MAALRHQNDRVFNRITLLIFVTAYKVAEISAGSKRSNRLFQASCENPAASANVPPVYSEEAEGGVSDFTKRARQQVAAWSSVCCTPLLVLCHMLRLWDGWTDARLVQGSEALRGARHGALLGPLFTGQ